MNKCFFKKMKKNGKIVEEKITNNFQGLYNYFSAANIREKVL